MPMDQGNFQKMFGLVSLRGFNHDFSGTPMKIVLIEDQAMFRDLLKKICREHFHLSVVGEAEDAATGLALCRKHKPDMVLLDLNLPDKDGVTMADELIAMDPEVRILALSTECDDYTLYRVLNSGMHGYVDKNRQSVEVLKQAIDEVIKGRVFFTEVVQQVRQKLRTEPKSFPKVLTEREQQLLALLGGGLTNEEVAQRAPPQPVHGAAPPAQHHEQARPAPHPRPHPLRGEQGLREAQLVSRAERRLSLRRATSASNDVSVERGVSMSPLRAASWMEVATAATGAAEMSAVCERMRCACRRVFSTAAGAHGLGEQGDVLVERGDELLGELAHPVGLLVGHVAEDRQVEGLAGRLLGGADLDRGAGAQRAAEVLDGGLDFLGAERLGGETVHARLEAVAPFLRRGVGGRGDRRACGARAAPTGGSGG